jgi:predicted nucleotidyltransferase
MAGAALPIGRFLSPAEIDPLPDSAGDSMGLRSRAHRCYLEWLSIGTSAMTPPQIFDLARPPVRPEEDLAARYRERVLRTFGDRVERIVLYGSRARGDPHDESDWDIAVFLDHEPNDADRDRLRKLEDGLGSGWQLQVLSFAGERWLGRDELCATSATMA